MLSAWGVLLENVHWMIPREESGCCSEGQWKESCAGSLQQETCLSLTGSPLVAQKSSSESFLTRNRTPRLSHSHFLSLGSAVSDQDIFLSIFAKTWYRDKKTLDIADFIFSCQEGNMGAKGFPGFCKASSETNFVCCAVNRNSSCGIREDCKNRNNCYQAAGSGKKPPASAHPVSPLVFLKVQQGSLPAQPCGSPIRAASYLPPACLGGSKVGGMVFLETPIYSKWIIYEALVHLKWKWKWNVKILALTETSLFDP